MTSHGQKLAEKHETPREDMEAKADGGPVEPEPNDDQLTLDDMGGQNE